MISNFQQKFKDKIRFVDKKGLKETLDRHQDNHNGVGFPKVNTHFYNSRIKSFDSSKRDFILSNNKNGKIPHKGSLKLKTMQSESNSPYLNEHKIVLKQQRHRTNHISLNHSQSQNQNYTMDAKPQHEIRNPELEFLAFKLKMKQKQKTIQNEVPKYIDEMIVKHEEILKKIDTKSSQRWKQLISLSKHNNKVENEKKGIPNNNTQIKLKRIDELIAQTNRNKEKQIQQMKTQQQIKKNKVRGVKGGEKIGSKFYNYNNYKDKSLKNSQVYQSYFPSINEEGKNESYLKSERTYNNQTYNF